MATKTKPYAGIKAQIKEAAQTLEQLILDSISKDQAKTDKTPTDILGELTSAFVGIYASAHYSFPQDGGSGGSDVVVTDLIVYFSNTQNQKHWPKAYYLEILNTLHHLLKMIEAIRTHRDLLFDFANLYQLKKREKKAGRWRIFIGGTVIETTHQMIIAAHKPV